MCNIRKVFLGQILIKPSRPYLNLYIRSLSLYYSHLRSKCTYLFKMKFGLDELGNPISEPFGSLEDILQWSASKFSFHSSNNFHLDNFSDDKNIPRKVVKPVRPQLLVCHDMSGGYLEDRFSQGSKVASGYRFYHWHLIDTFIYFSHHFITIPPIGWIKAAHRHGVTVLGTIITEWDDGAETCKNLLKSKQFIDEITAKLAQMAAFYGFDGWLINIENKIEIDQVPLLEYFVQSLTAKCHAILDFAKVLWYDSVTVKGELDWQNELNAANEIFFHVCDGIFLNYCITEEKLEQSRVLASKTGREFDVYVGIDAFGRGTPGGGGFNCKEVLKMAQDHSLSSAIFAPGWTHEFLKGDNFEDNEIMYWGIIAQLVTPRPVTIPFATSFCQGFGHHYYIEGQQISSQTPWCNLLTQQIQPSFTQSQFLSYTVTKFIDQVANEEAGVKEKVRIETSVSHLHPASPKMELDLNTAYIGGGSLKMTTKGNEPVWFKMFKVNSQNCKNISVTVTWKIDESRTNFAMVLCNSAGESTAGSYVILELSPLSDRHREWIGGVYCTKLYCSVPSKQEHRLLAGGFMSSTFHVDTSGFLEGSNPEFMLCAVLLPQHSDVDGSGLCCHIGQIVICEDSSKLEIPKPSIKSLWCLGVQTELPLSTQGKEKIVLHPCLNMYGVEEGGLDENSVTGSVSEPSSRSFSDLNLCVPVSSISTASLEASASSSSIASESTFYVLKWDTLSVESVDYFLVFSYDQRGVKTLLGQVAAQTFVYKKTEQQLSSFAVVPVFLSNNFLGDEVVFYL